MLYLILTFLFLGLMGFGYYQSARDRAEGLMGLKNKKVNV
jgi:hypothetical protein